MASGSRYFLELFSKYGPYELTTVKVPEPFNQAHEIVQTDQVSIILKYIYHNQVSLFPLKTHLNVTKFKSDIFYFFAVLLEIQAH